MLVLCKKNGRPVVSRARCTVFPRIVPAGTINFSVRIYAGTIRGRALLFIEIVRIIFSLTKKPPDYAAAPQFGLTFRVFYDFQLESSIVTSFSEHPQRQFPSLRGKTAGYTEQASALYYSQTLVGGARCEGWYYFSVPPSIRFYPYFIRNHV